MVARELAPISFVDLRVDAEEEREITGAVQRVLRRGWFVLGPEVAAFEEELADSIGRRRAVAVGNGTDALVLTLRALGIGGGDEVVVPAFTAFPTAAAIVLAGATPVLVDVSRDRPVLDHRATIDALTPHTRAVIVVHLYGAAADAGALAADLSACGRDDIAVIEDCAQAQGALLPSGRPVGAAGVASAFSFYPTKNLAALGDGGAVVTDDERLADEVRAWRSHGERGTRYVHHLAAGNSRLDDVQAAVLRARLARLSEMIGRRRMLSDRYASALPSSAGYLEHGAHGAPHLAVVQLDDRVALAGHLDQLGITTGVHYPRPLCDQPALDGVARLAGSCPNARRIAERCLSLPLHLGLSDDDIDRVARAVTEWTQGPSKRASSRPAGSGE